MGEKRSVVASLLRAVSKLRPSMPADRAERGAPIKVVKLPHHTLQNPDPQSPKPIVIDSETFERIFDDAGYQYTNEAEKQTVRSNALTGLQGLLAASAMIAKVVVLAADNAAVQINYIDLEGRAIRRDVIPQAALRAAMEDGRIFLQQMERSGNFDAELLGYAKAALERDYRKKTRQL